jgi:hypothetical protein
MLCLSCTGEGALRFGREFYSSCNTSLCLEPALGSPGLLQPHTLPSLAAALWYLCARALCTRQRQGGAYFWRVYPGLLSSCPLVGYNFLNCRPIQQGPLGPVHRKPAKGLRGYSKPSLPTGICGRSPHSFLCIPRTSLFSPPGVL